MKYREYVSDASSEDSSSLVEEETGHDYMEFEEGPKESTEPQDITPDKDGGVIKKLITAGHGWKNPSSGDKVTVDYVGKLVSDGTVFDSSRDRGDQFKFTVGKGEVIKGWDIAVKSMKRGEVASFILKPEYAYGSSGSPPKIPPDSTLEFEIELYDWELEDLTKKKDGGVRKAIVKDGSGYLMPNDGSTVSVRLVGKHNDQVFDEREVSFVLGEGSEEQICDGVEMAVLRMKKNEIATVFINSKYAWGSNPPASMNLPADYEEITYQVELKSFEKRKETWEMDNEERLEQAELAKNKGSNYFRQGKYGLALRQYKLIPQNIGPPDNNDFDESTSEKKNAVLLAGYLNLAMCYLKLNKPHDVIKNCELALGMDAKNDKGLFRRGQAYYALKEYEKAKADFETVVKNDPNNVAAKQQVNQCISAIRAQQEKDKATYAGMFAKFAAVDDAKERKAARDVWKELNDEEKREFKSGDSAATEQQTIESVEIIESTEA